MEAPSVPLPRIPGITLGIRIIVLLRHTGYYGYSVTMRVSPFRWSHSSRVNLVRT